MRTPASNAPGVYASRDELIGMRAAPLGVLQSPARNARALLFGESPSRQRGAGIAFEEVRPYQSGDDVRAIDWRVSARTGSTHTKVFNSERERPVFLLLDQRSSMFFGSGALFKSVFAARLAAQLAWEALAAGERVGGQIAGDTQSHILPARRGRPAVLEFLNTVCTANQALPRGNFAADEAFTLGQWFDSCRRVTPRGCELVVISDFHGFDSRAEQGLGMLAPGRQLTLVQVSDPLERTLPVRGRLGISNGVTATTISVTGAFRARYRSWRATRNEQLAAAAQRCRAVLVRASTHDSQTHVVARMQRRL